jgi:hypothetical protein
MVPCSISVPVDRIASVTQTTVSSCGGIAVGGVDGREDGGVGWLDSDRLGLASEVFEEGGDEAGARFSSLATSARGARVPSVGVGDYFFYWREKYNCECPHFDSGFIGWGHT